MAAAAPIPITRMELFALEGKKDDMARVSALTDPVARDTALRIFAAVHSDQLPPPRARVLIDGKVEELTPEALKAFAGRDLRFYPQAVMSRTVAERLIYLSTLRSGSTEKFSPIVASSVPLALVRLNERFPSIPAPLGLGVLATRDIRRGESICSYGGEYKLGEIPDGATHSIDLVEGIYVDGSTYTNEGAIIPDSSPNVDFRMVGLNKFPYFEDRVFALRDIEEGELLFVDYGNLKSKKGFYPLNPAGLEEALRLLQPAALRGLAARVELCGGVERIRLSLSDSGKQSVHHDVALIQHVFRSPELLWEMLFSKRISYKDVTDVLNYYEETFAPLQQEWVPIVLTRYLNGVRGLDRILAHPYSEDVFEEMKRRSGATSLFDIWNGWLYSPHVEAIAAQLEAGISREAFREYLRSLPDVLMGAEALLSREGVIRLERLDAYRRFSPVPSVEECLRILPEEGPLKFPLLPPLPAGLKS